MATSLPTDKIIENAQELAAHSWEYGVISEALLQLLNPELSVFGSDPFPAGKPPVVDAEAASGLLYAKNFIKTSGKSLIDGEGSSADPASLGVAAILLSQNDATYLEAAREQSNTLVNDTPRLQNGAISHREKEAEAWSDFIYMGPPFLGYLGVATGEPNLLEVAASQCLLYEDILRDTGTGLWKHVVGPEHEDLGIWSTGCGWAAAGMTRVLATMIKSPWRSEPWMKSLTTSLLEAVTSILNGAIAQHKDVNGLLRNYITEEAWFGEITGTAGLVSALYRLAVLFPGQVTRDQLNWADECWLSVLRCIDHTTGLVGPVVNPLKCQSHEPLSASAEGQAFVLLMIAARRQWEEMPK